MRSARHLLHFLAIGAALFAAERRFASPPPFALPASRVAARAAAFARETGAAPDARVQRLLERDARDEELLAREARRLGLDRDDAVVRERLVNNMAFATSPDLPPERLYREALALGMDATDAVVRRRLAARMTARLRDAVAREPIDEASLRAWFEAHRERFAQPATVRVAQLCFAAAGDAATRAHAALASLRDAPDSRIPALGDPCLFGNELAPQSEADLARSFGTAFAHAVFATEPGRWSGPLASNQGLHLVFVRERTAAREAEFDAMREAVRVACVADRQEAAERDGIARLRAEAAR